MTEQSRRSSAMEAASQAAIGLPIGLIVSFVVTCAHFSPGISASIITTLMFLASVLRGYLIRRKFERDRR